VALKRRNGLLLAHLTHGRSRESDGYCKDDAS